MLQLHHTTLQVSIGCALSLMIGFHMACLYRIDRQQFLNHLLSGAIFTLMRNHGDAPKQELPFCGECAALLARACIGVMAAGVLVAESALPTVTSLLHDPQRPLIAAPLPRHSAFPCGW